MAKLELFSLLTGAFRLQENQQASFCSKNMGPILPSRKGYRSLSSKPTKKDNQSHQNHHWKPSTNTPKNHLNINHSLSTHFLQVSQNPPLRPHRTGRPRETPRSSNAAAAWLIDDPVYSKGPNRPPEEGPKLAPRFLGGFLGCLRTCLRCLDA